MALLTIDKLIEGNHSVVEAYLNVKNLWIELLADIDWNNSNVESALAKLVGIKQLDFEHVVGDRLLGQEIMVTVGIGQFYNREMGFDKDYRKAKLIYNAFLLSYCSMEVKFCAEEVGKLYRLEEGFIDEDLKNIFDK